MEPVGVDAMALDAIRFSDKELRRVFGESARKRAETTFAEDPIIDLYESLYERVLASPKSSVEISAHPR